MIFWPALHFYLHLLLIPLCIYFFTWLVIHYFSFMTLTTLVQNDAFLHLVLYVFVCVVSDKKVKYYKPMIISNNTFQINLVSLLSSNWLRTNQSGKHISNTEGGRCRQYSFLKKKRMKFHNWIFCLVMKKNKDFWHFERFLRDFLSRDQSRDIVFIINLDFCDKCFQVI